jgi:pyridoxal phosphate enzyme (YggS family)
LQPVIESGQRVFGENRVQEAKSKWPALIATQPAIALHLIGPLQSNKAKEAVALFDAIHSVDRPSICEALSKEMKAQQRTPQLFVQLNTGEEPQKAGIAPGEADDFLARCRDTYGLTISGLMCIPPVNDAPAPHFALTAKIAARNGLTQLSMGMSADFAIAIQFGATHVRVGSAIFGTYASLMVRRRHLAPSRTMGRLAPKGVTSFGMRPRARGLADHDLRLRSDPGQQPQHGWLGHGDAARGRREFWSGQMQEHRAASSGDPRPGVLVDLDDEVVEMILAGQPVAVISMIEPDRPIVMPVCMDLRTSHRSA